MEEGERNLPVENELWLHRQRVIEERGLAFFRTLTTELERGCKELAGAKPTCGALVCELYGERNVAVRNLDARPSVKATVHLGRVGLNISVEERQSPSYPFILKRHHRVEFSLDESGDLVFCMECCALDLDGIAKLIIRPLLGLV
jgi:hypothetical protein